jgi:hypothetical protein
MRKKRDHQKMNGWRNTQERAPPRSGDIMYYYSCVVCSSAGYYYSIDDGVYRRTMHVLKEYVFICGHDERRPNQKKKPKK